MKKKNIITGIAHIMSTFNNTIISVSDSCGIVIAWASSGQSGFKGSRKATPYAAQVAAENAARKAKDLGIKTISINIQGPGTGRDSAIRGLINSGLNVTTINDITPIPHNGCRPPKRRRV